MPTSTNPRLKADGTLRIVPVGPDDDGLDPDWILLPDQEKWDQVRRFIARGTEFERRFASRDVSLRVDRDRNVLEGLPRSQAAYRALRERNEK